MKQFTYGILMCSLGFFASGCTSKSNQSSSKQSSAKNSSSTASNPKKKNQQVSNVDPTTNKKNVSDPTAQLFDGDCKQWGGTSHRNNVRRATNVPIHWNTGIAEDGEFHQEKVKNIKWKVNLGSQSYGNPVVADGRIFIGTNNRNGWLKRYPHKVDLGCLLAFNEKDGKFLWQHSSEKLSIGRVNDWLLQGICSTSYVEEDRLWFVSSRGHVICLDTQGFYDGEDDGPVKNQWARQFKVSKTITAGLENSEMTSTIKNLFEKAGVKLSDDTIIEELEPNTKWELIIETQVEGQEDPQEDKYLITSNAGKVSAYRGSKADQDNLLFQAPLLVHTGLDEKKVTPAIRNLFANVDIKLPEKIEMKVVAAGKSWSFTAAGRNYKLMLQGPYFTASRQTTVDDKHEADTVWVFDMMKEFQSFQHNMCSCSVTAMGDILFVNTSNGVDASHKNLPAPNAPSFFAMDKNTGKVLWTDKSPGLNILHGQWSSPACGVLGGVPQVIFAGGDGWVYSFHAKNYKDGKPQLLWKFDCNPKESLWELQGRGTRNNIIATPVLYQEKVYVAVGQDPEHGDGVGHLWCIDPTKRGNSSPTLAFSREEAKKPANQRKELPHRRLQAVDKTKGEVVLPNPNTAVVWHYSKFDRNGDQKIDFTEEMHRSCGTVAIKDDLLFIADFSGVFHCINALTGKPYWAYDMLSGAWGSPLIVDGKVFIGDDEGEISIFKLSAKPEVAMKKLGEEWHPINAWLDEGIVKMTHMGNSVYSTPIVANNVLYIANKKNLYAIVNQEKDDEDYKKK